MSVPMGAYFAALSRMLNITRSKSAGSTCIPSRIGRKALIPHAGDRYRLRHKIENMFARLTYRRRIAMRYARCPILVLFACALAATVIYWL